MKKSTRIAKSSESLKVLSDNKPIHNRRSDPLIRPSLHPWYYVKGRKDLTEKNISSRREREEQRHKQSVSDNQYFTRRLAESQVFDKWKDNKTLAKYPKDRQTSRPPFDVSIEPKPDPKPDFKSDKQLEKKYLNSKQKLKQFMVKFKELNEKYSELENRQNILVFSLTEIKETDKSIKDKKEFYELMERRLHSFRLNRDKLRKKVFLIINQLNYYKTSIQKIQHLTAFDAYRQVMADEEMIALTEVLNKALKIFEMYIELNENRNNEFQIMFDEEADGRWEDQEEEWLTEYQVWNVMIEKLMDSFKNIVKDKLNHILSEEKSLLEERERLLKDLTAFTVKIQSEPKLAFILNENIYDFMTEVKNC